MMALAFALVGFLSAGVILFALRRGEIRRAMMADGFAAHEVRKALRLYDRKRHADLAIYCRDVIERKALAVSRDWTKAKAYQ